MDEPEKVLLHFGPFGTGVCFNRPSFFTIIQKNDTRIVVTDREICGELTFKRNSLMFNIRCEVVSIDLFGHTLWKVRWL